jgi:hypothetical protein
MITGPDVVHRLIKDEATFGDVERWTVGVAADHDVVDPAPAFKGHLSGADDRVARAEGVARYVGVGRCPGVFVAHARPRQRLFAFARPCSGASGRLEARAVRSSLDDEHAPG